MADTSGQVVGDYVGRELDREEQRRQRLESRAGVALSASASAIAIMYAALTFAGDAGKTVPHGEQRTLLLLGLALLGVSVVCGLVVLMPRGELGPDPDDLATYLDPDVFDEPPRYSARRVAEASLAALRSVSSGNNLKAAFLAVGQLAQALAIVSIGTVVGRLF